MADRKRVVAAEIQRGGRYLITRRLRTSVLPDLWEFPGGRVREGETDAEALRRALQQRIAVDVTVGERVQEVVHAYADYTLEMTVYRCFLEDEEPRAQKVAALAWVLPEEFANYPFPGADQKTVDALLKED